VLLNSSDLLLLSNIEFTTKLACWAWLLYRRTFLNYLSDYRRARQLFWLSSAFLLSKPAVASCFASRAFFYSCSLGVEFSWTWPPVCCLTHLLLIPL